MHGRDRAGRERLEHEVAVGDRVERIRRRAVEAERMRGHVAIERKRSAGERGGTERTFIEPRTRVFQPAAIARRHLHIGEKMMPERDRLRGLQMGKARHHGAGMRQRLLRQRLLITGKRGVEFVDRVADPELEIGRHLVITRTRRVQPAGGGPDQFVEPLLDIHVNVFERPVELETAGFDL